MYEQNIICPYCRSMHTTAKNTGRKLGTAAGALGGGAHGLSTALAGAKTGYTVFRVMGPPGMALGTIAGAVLGAIVGASSFGFMGAKLGELVDNTILDNYRCLDCGKSFNPTRFMAEIPLMGPSTITGASRYNSRTIDGRFIDEETDGGIDDEMSDLADHWEQVSTQHPDATNHLGNKSGEGDFSTGDNSNAHSSKTSDHGCAPHDWPIVPYTTSDLEGDGA